MSGDEKDYFELNLNTDTIKDVAETQKDVKSIKYRARIHAVSRANTESRSDILPFEVIKKPTPQ